LGFCNQNLIIRSYFPRKDSRKVALAELKSSAFVSSLHYITLHYITLQASFQFHRRCSKTKH